MLTLEKSFNDSSILPENEQIFKDVSHIVDQTFQNLDRKYTLFNGCIVHKVGSAGEGTKVGVFDEFDYMVELPELENQVLKEAVPFTHTNDPYTCVRMNKLQFILEFMPTSKSIETNREPNEMPDVFGEIKKLVFNEMKSILRPPWTPGPNFRIGDSEDKGKVRTIRLRKTRPDNSHIDVFLDLSFCVPFIWTPERRRLLKRAGTKDDLASTDSHKYRLLLRNGPFWNATTALQEKDKLVNSLTSDQVKRVYRMSKIIIRTYLPPIYDYELDTFEALIPSYWIKQILLFMMDYFPDPSSWVDELIGVRVYEVFFQLQVCLETNLLANYFQPMHNHVLDESKSKNTNLLQKYVPALSQILRGCILSDEKALGALSSLEKLTQFYRETIQPNSKRMRLLLLLLRYKGLANHQKHFVECTKFFSRVSEADKLFSVITDYLFYHADHIVLNGRGCGVIISDNGTEYSLDEYIKVIRDDPLTFPDDWEVFYQRLWEENLPTDRFQVGISTTGLRIIRLGEIVRKTFGDKPQRLSMGDEVSLTLAFLID